MEQSVRQRTWWLLFVLMVIVLCIGIDFAVRKFLVMPSFYRLERQEASQKMASVVAAIKREAYHVGKLASDWAAWDDTYQFVQDGNKAYIKSNFQWESLISSGIDLVYVCDLTGKVVWGGIFYPPEDKTVTLRRFPKKAFSPNDILLTYYKSHKEPWGILLTEKGPMLITSQPILTSAKTGPPKGTLIMGRFLNKSIIHELEKQTHVMFTLKDIETGKFSPEERSNLAQLAGKRFVYRILNDRQLKVFATIPDIQGKPALLVSALFRRDIVQNGRATATLTSFSFIAAFAVVTFFVILWFVFFKKESQRRQKEITALVEDRTRELRESEEQLRTLINATPDIICFKDGQGRWLEANQADLELFHLTGVDYRGKKDSELAQYTHAVFKEAFLHCEETDERAWQKGVLTRSEESIETPGGIVKIYDVIKVPIFNEDGSRKGLIVFGRDITQEKKLQDKLQKAEKMQAIGLMAGGVAHDLNNILSGIIAYPDLLLLQLPEDSNLRRSVTAIQEAGKRASEVVADLLTIARGVAAPRQAANLNSLIEEYLESPEYLKLLETYSNIQVKIELEPELKNIICSPVHIKKCLMNLVTNAMEAIEGPGMITIVTRNQTVTRSQARKGYVEPGDYAVLAVADTGPGIPEKDLEHIFDPFYTKKVMGKSGTGLGLAIVWNTLHDHGGCVEVASDQKGTVFTLYFPCTTEEVNDEYERVKVERLQGHGEKILVIDDEKHQQKLAEEILTSLGYEVVTVGSGEEALEYLRKQPVDLVTLDMILGSGMDGRQTYERIISIRPGQKALIVSGYCEDQLVKAVQAMGAGEFIRKPYTLIRIGLAVKRALAREEDADKHKR